ncbi:MAG: hypothetical protein KGD72_04490 [Candidatus Lokiarchaeota archaeon]|nr:hypothetical protein [Candidatus Lokiarchaeota archaeon]
MSENTIVLKGKVREFTKSYSGNLSFTLEDSQNNLHYCFTTKKSSLVSTSDDVIIFGSYTSGNKVRINYIINQTRNSEGNMVEASKDWMYQLSLIGSIGTTIGFIVAILYSLGIFPVDYGYMGIISSIYAMIFSIVLIILLLPAMIVFWVLTNSFSKKRKRESELDAEISKFKHGISSPIKSSESTSKLSAIQVEAEDYGKKTQFCSHCGAKMLFEAKFCPSCGSEQ